jgi:microcystin-dependent protein
MDPAIAVITMFGGDFAPRGWALCQGQILSIAQNTALFSLLGTTFGGNGQTTFALPDLRGRTPLHAGQGPGLSPYSLGQQSGSESGTLLIGNLPVHTHAATFNFAVSSNAATTDEPGGAVPANGSTTAYLPGGVVSGQLGGVSSTTVGITGGSQPFSLRQPYLGINFIIALFGIFPSRN